MADTFLFSFNEKSSLLLFFFLNGIILASLLAWKWIDLKERSSFWLATFLGLCIFYIAPFMLGYAAWYTQETYRNILFYLPLQQLLLIGPVIYFYTRSLLNTSFKFSGSEWLHFIPAIIYNLGMLVVFVNDQVISSEIYFYADGRDMDLDPWYQWLGLVSMVAYLILSIRFYNEYKQIIFEQLSFADELLFTWVKQFLVAFLGILILRVLFFILNPEWGEFGSKFWYYLCFSILFIFIGFRGYIHSIQHQINSRAFYIAQNSASSLITTGMQKDLGSSQPEINNLSRYLEQLEILMNEKKAFQNSTLTLSDVADELETNTKTISTIVNSQFDMNFNDWVNRYRAKEVIRKFEEGQHKQQTLLAIALDSGFNSKSTFNRAFKKHTGTTPARYVERL